MGNVVEREMEKLTEKQREWAEHNGVINQNIEIEPPPQLKLVPGTKRNKTGLKLKKKKMNKKKNLKGGH